MAGPLGREVPGEPEPLVNRRSQGGRLSRAQQNPRAEDQPGGGDPGTASAAPVPLHCIVLSVLWFSEKGPQLASMLGGISPQPSLTHPLCFVFVSSSHPNWAASRAPAPSPLCRNC